MTARRCSLLALVVGLVLAVLGGPSASAAARPVAIKLTGSGPVPVSVTISVGDQLVFVNTDNLAHRVTATKGFTFDVTVAAGKTSAPTPVFAAAGTDTYRDSRLSPVLSQSIQDVTGIVKVTAASPSPSSSSSASAAPRPTSSASPRPTSSGAASPEPTAAGPAASPRTSAAPAAPGSTGGAGGAGGSSGPGPGGTGGSGTATSPLLPGFLGGSLGPPAAAPETGPAPNVAPPAPPAPPALPGSDGAVAGGPPVPGAGALVSGSTGTAGSPTSGGSLAQRSPGRHYGLPAALAVVVIAGVLSLLVRLLLSEPAALRRRSAPVARRQVTVAG